MRYQWRTEKDALVIRFRQSGDFEFPVTVTLVHEGRTTTEVVIAVTGNESEQRIESPAPIRDVIVNGDEASLAIFSRSDS